MPLPTYLIAHRGGVVDAERSENSYKALDEAVRRGYTHVEIDARITGDGEVVCFHNDDLMEEAGVDGRISRMSLDQVTRTILARSGEGIPTFEDYCARCSGRIGVMIDLKGCSDEHVPSYGEKIERALMGTGLLDDALILINRTPVNNQAAVARRFLGKCRVSWRSSLSETREAAIRAPGFSDRYFVFNHAEEFSPADILGYHELRIPLIASINTYHYKEGDPLVLGRNHIRQLQGNGVDGFQIDSVYDPEFFT